MERPRWTPTREQVRGAMSKIPLDERVERPAQIWKRLLDSSVHHKLVYERTLTDPLSEEHLLADNALKVNKDEFRRRLTHGDSFDDLLEQGFDATVDARVARHYRRQRRGGGKRE